MTLLKENMDQKTKIQLPDFKLDETKIPEVKIKSIRFENFKAFDDYAFDFWDGDKCKPFVCLHGPNGCGKTTVLDAIAMIFSNYEGRELSHLIALLGKSVRHVDGVQKAIYDKKSNFLITADIQSSIGDYQIQINKSGFVNDHPQEIRSIISRICFYAKFDLELHQFQLLRDKWNIFKDLFEAVTGFEIMEREGVFSESSDPAQANILKKYVLSFMIQKPDEIISHKECSAGERKIIKSFSTLLNKEANPSIVCIDNAEMHVESGRHINLMESMKRCFPNTQLFATTHSYQISRNFGTKNQLYDMRLLKASPLIKEETWRLYMIDEIKDCVSKLKSFTICKEMTTKLINKGAELIKKCMEKDDKDFCLLDDCEDFFKKTSQLFIEDIVSYYKNKK